MNAGLIVGSGGWATLPPLMLAPDEVDVWRANLDGPPAETFESLRALLSADEEERAARFYFERDRRRFVVARGVLRLLLSRYTGTPPHAIRFAYGPHGKPTLATRLAVVEGDPTPLYFNVAHSEGLGMYAFTRVGEVGIDVERIRDISDWESIAEVSFAAPLLAHLRKCPPEKQREEFFRAWTRQEAVLKALGTGLVGPRPDQPAYFGGTNQAELQVQSLKTDPGFVAALAASGAWRMSPCVHTWAEDGAGSPNSTRNRTLAAKARRHSDLRSSLS